jgi:hypothetical protein
MKLRARGDGVVTRLETGDRRHDDVKGNRPCGGVLGSRWDSRIIARRQLKNFTKLEATIGDNVVVFLLVGIESFHSLLRLWRWSELRQRAEDLTTGNSADIDVVSENGSVGCGNGERNLGKGGIQGFNADNVVLFVEQPESAEKTVDLNVWVRRPHSDVIPMLICDPGTLGIKLDMNTVPFCGRLEKFAGR